MCHLDKNNMATNMQANFYVHFCETSSSIFGSDCTQLLFLNEIHYYDLIVDNSSSISLKKYEYLNKR